MRGVCDYVSELGYIDSSNATVKNTKKTVKKCFKKHLQRKMMISMNDVIIESFDNINDFVRSYYIESPKVRAMKVKAHMIIKKLFVFFMEHEEMLPIEYQQRMEYCTQSLLETKYNDEKDPSGANGHHLAFQYLQERYLEHQWQHNKRDRKASASHVHLSDIIRFLNSQPEKINLPKILTELIHIGKQIQRTGTQSQKQRMHMTRFILNFVITSQKLVWSLIISLV